MLPLILNGHATEDQELQNLIMNVTYHDALIRRGDELMK